VYGTIVTVSPMRLHQYFFFIGEVRIHNLTSDKL